MKHIVHFFRVTPAFACSCFLPLRLYFNMQVLKSSPHVEKLTASAGNQLTSPSWHPAGRKGSCANEMKRLKIYISLLLNLVEIYCRMKWVFESLFEPRITTRSSLWCTQGFFAKKTPANNSTSSPEQLHSSYLGNTSLFWQRCKKAGHKLCDRTVHADFSSRGALPLELSFHWTEANSSVLEEQKKCFIAFQRLSM